MSRTISIIHRLLLWAAFVGVMAGTGGLAGGIGGVLMVLMGRIVLGTANDLVVFMPAGSGVGALAAMALGIFLTMRPLRPLAMQPSITPATASAGVSPVSVVGDVN